VADVAAVRQVPLDLPGMLLLTILASCTHRRVVVNVGRSFEVWTNCYVAIALPPGSRKSGVFRDMMRPIKIIEKEMIEQEMPQIMFLKEKAGADEGRLRILRTKAEKAKSDDDRDYLLRDIVEIQENTIKPPEPPQLWVGGDAGLEVLAKILEDQDERISIFDDEGGVFAILSGLYNHGNANIDIVLKSWGGDAHRVRRMSREGINLEAPIMTVGLCVQPAVIRSLADKKEFRGRGLLGRFLFSMPRSLVGTRMYQERGLRADLTSNFEQLIRELFAATDPKKISHIHLEGEALAQWVVYANNIEKMQLPGRDLEHVDDWAGKIAGMVASIIGNLHCVRYRNDDPAAHAIDVDVVLAGWAIGEYLVSHALKTFGVMNETKDSRLSRKIMEWISKEGIELFTLRDLQRRFRTIKKQDDFLPALKELEDRGLIILERPSSSTPIVGRPKGGQYRTKGQNRGVLSLSNVNDG